MKPGTIHAVIPDCQVKEGVPLDHLDWIGRYLVDEYKGSDLTVVNLGDFWDLPSLSSWDKGKRSMEGRRYKADVKVGNTAFALLDAPMTAVQKSWKPKKHFILGNHENRITRANEDNAQLEGTISLDDLDTRGWKVHPFLEIAALDGISYSHYFYNQSNGRPYGGMAETRLKTIGGSFTQGHQQGLQTAQRSVLGKRHRALICGSAYMHTEEYRGPQARNEWRGILVCHNVSDGNYDLMEVSLDYLSRRYTKKGVRLYK